MPQTPSSLSESFIRRARESPRRAGVDTALRTLDVGLSLLFLAVAAIPILVIAFAILATSGRPVFYRGRRVGRGGHFYTMLKFRTLRPGAEERLGPFLGPELVERTREERTRIGRWLRATQLDELPQLWNVIRGDMSLVGPRPIRPIFFEQLASDLPAYWQRLVVRPGHELKLVYPQEGAAPEDFAGLDFERFSLQPMDGPDVIENTARTVDYCLRHPQWRLSLQTHKTLGIR